MSHIKFAPNAKLADNAARVRGVLGIVETATPKTGLPVWAYAALGAFIGLLVAIVIL